MLFYIKNADTQISGLTVECENGKLIRWGSATVSIPIDEIVRRGEESVTDLYLAASMLQNEYNGLSGGAKAVSIRGKTPERDEQFISNLKTICKYFESKRSEQDDWRVVLGYAFMNNEGNHEGKPDSDWLYCPQIVIFDYDNGRVLHYFLTTTVSPEGTVRYCFNAFSSKEQNIPKHFWQEIKTNTTELQIAGYELDNAVIVGTRCIEHLGALRYEIKCDGSFYNERIILSEEETIALLKNSNENCFENLKGKRIRIAIGSRTRFIPEYIGDIIDDKKWIKLGR